MSRFNVVEDNREYNEVEDAERDLKENYKNAGHPIAFSGINQIYNFYNGALSIRQIKEILAGIESYTLHREYHKGKRNTTYSHFKRYQFQMDLVEIQQLSKYNDGVRYLLNVIDTFTRYAFVRPLENKKAPTVLEAFKSILEEANQKPLKVVMDKGSEFSNQLFTNFCEKNKIELYNPEANTHAAFIERFNRTLQTIIYKYLTENETNRFIDKLQDLVSSYNKRKHRMIEMSPNDAEMNTNNHLKINLLAKKREEKITKKFPQLQLNTYVRIAKQKGKFSRGYNEQSNQEIFKIYKISTSKKIPLYYLETYNGSEKIKGGFYSFELTPVKTAVFRVEKILRRRKYRGKNQLFVKWKGFSNDYNEWINQSDVEQEF
jgi:Integrase core domain/Chromo (CHRromatin Organisation MOdifier) domain